ncbi:hypothetical protein DSO57_1002627 [Entomophthora muscae]|uniref:Uncharacterized protein n=1 Tax=Entomophthora muscae TaxID=34485 RepID=A0ACC2SXR3_9FUNG|nr:hypothetical protein DSO57_1002627 [Entomophthora muscae]
MSLYWNREKQLFGFLTLRNSLAPLILVVSDPTVHVLFYILWRLSLATTSRDYSSRATSLGFPVVFLCCVSDHNNSSLTWLCNMKDPEERLTGMAAKFQKHDFDIIHCPGTKHGNAYVLSHLPLVSALQYNLDSIYEKIDCPETWFVLSPKLQAFLKKLSCICAIKNGELYKEVCGCQMPYICISCCLEELQELHKQMCHLGVKRMLDIMF